MPDLQFENQTQKSLQYKVGSLIKVTEWTVPQASVAEMQALVTDASFTAFDGRALPPAQAGEVLSRHCQTLASVTREDASKTIWTAFIASDLEDHPFDVGACRRVDNILFLGFYATLYALSLKDGAFLWARRLEGSKLKALRVPSDKQAVIVHGTSSMYRVNLEGRIEWECFGAADFGEGLRLCQDVIEVRDVDRNIYLIEYRTGDFAIRPPPLAERMRKQAPP